MMKKLFTEPVMEIKRFEGENVVTSSAGVEVDPNSLSESNDYAVMTLDIFDHLEFSF